MGKISYHFITSIFNLALVYILAINFTGWSGAWVDILGTQTDVNWSNSYFGFQSVQMMLSDFQNSIDYTKMNFSNLLNAFTELIQVITFHLPKLFSDLANDSVDIFSLLQVLFDMLFQPVLLIFYIVQFAAYFLTYVAITLNVLFRAFAGKYNVPFDSIPDYHPTSMVIPPVLASGFML